MEDQAMGPPTSILEFGAFQYNLLGRELSGAGGPVRVGSRALQLLEVLLESPGKLFGRKELEARVWPNLTVDETSLRVHMSALRRVLGECDAGQKYITNVPGRGYAFVAEVRPLSSPASTIATGAAPSAEAHRSPLPTRLSRLVGRDGDLSSLGELVVDKRLVSIVGAGGMGKTSIAWALVEQQQGLHEHGAVFVDLSTLVDAAQVVVEVGQACGLDLERAEPWGALERKLREQRLLLVLDNCEHVVEAAASLAERLLCSCPGLHILATSREPLELQAEWVFRLPPLALPEPEDELDLQAARAYPALQLFIERTKAGSHQFELTEANLPAVRKLCEFLDGIPLAIELAAARVDSLGIHGLLQRLEKAFELLTRGRRTAASRHQTLHAVLKWSYELLTDTEKLVLQRIAAFRSTFSLDGAAAVASDVTLPARAAREGVLNLCQKSLVISDRAEDGSPRHRLLYITRLFAERMLLAAPEAMAVRRRHAEYMLRCMLEFNKMRRVMTQVRATPALVSAVAELRAANDWAIVAEQDIRLGSELIVESTRTWLSIGAMDEFRRLILAALDKAKRGGTEGTTLESRLQVIAAYCDSLALGGSESHRRASVLDDAAIDRFDQIDDRIEALLANCATSYGHGQYRRMLPWCERVRELAQGEFEPLSIAVGDRYAALSLHALGRHDEAEQLARRVASMDASALQPRFQSTVPFPVSMGLRLARIHWIRGEFETAWRLTEEFASLDASYHIYARCQPLALTAVPLAIWKGELEIAAQWNRDLLAQTTQGNLPYWRAYAEAYETLLGGRPQDVDLKVLSENPPLMDIWTTLHSGAPSSLTLARVGQGEVGWCAPEVLRRAALEKLNVGTEVGHSSCLRELRAAFEMSTKQGARFWSLRVANSIREVSAPEAAERAWARDQLIELLSCIDDGSMQPDLVRARGLARAGS
jgi:predicted ATPase/DNA-binding winged helix-turn-helix (wHTH) protein